MKISYAITVCNEFVEIQNLVRFLLENKRPEDEIVILYDEKNGDEGVEFFLRAKSVNSSFAWHSAEFNDHFANWKNKPEIKWKNKVHEVLEGFKTYAPLPAQEELALYHPKEIERQEKQNAYYDTL